MICRSPIIRFDLEGRDEHREKYSIDHHWVDNVKSKTMRTNLWILQMNVEGDDMCEEDHLASKSSTTRSHPIGMLLDHRMKPWFFDQDFSIVTRTKQHGCSHRKRKWETSVAITIFSNRYLRIRNRWRSSSNLGSAFSSSFFPDVWRDVINNLLHLRLISLPKTVIYWICMLFSWRCCFAMVCDSFHLITIHRKNRILRASLVLLWKHSKCSVLLWSTADKKRSSLTVVTAHISDAKWGDMRNMTPLFRSTAETAFFEI